MKVKLKIKKIDSEYCVQWIEEGVFIESKSYYTDCKQDATDTKQAMINAINTTKHTNITLIK